MRRTIDDMVYGCPFLEILLFDAVPPTSPKSQLPTIQKASMRVNGPLHDNAFSFIFINMVRFYRKEYLTISLATSYNPLAFEKKFDYTSDDSLIFWTNFNWCFYFVFDIDLISFNGWGWCVLTCMEIICMHIDVKNIINFCTIHLNRLIALHVRITLGGGI